MIIDIPTVEGGEFIDGGPNTLGTIVRASFLNSLMKSSTATTKEIQTVLSKNGIQPDDRVHDQLFKAISKMVTDGKVTLTDVLGTSKTLAASQFLVNEVSKSVDLVGIQVTKNTKELENKMNLGAGGWMSNTVEMYTSDSDENIDASLRTSVIRGDGKSQTSNVQRWGGGFQVVLGSDAKKNKSLYRFQMTEQGVECLFKNANFKKIHKLITSDDLDGLLQVPVDQIFYFDSATPPTGFIARNGQAIDKAKMPKLFAKYGANMPDDRDRVHRMTGPLAGAVGTTQEDAIQNIRGSVSRIRTEINPSSSEAFNILNTYSAPVGGTVTSASTELYFDASRVVRTADEVRVKSRIIIACNKIQ